MARFLLHRVAEEFDVAVSFDPKPTLRGTWTGVGAHINFSTKQMREENGIKQIEKAIAKLRRNHEAHMLLYDPKGGDDNKRRLLDGVDHDSLSKFMGVGDRTVAVRISKDVVKEGKGYFEDRRPAANADPYDVMSAIVETVCLDRVPKWSEKVKKIKEKLLITKKQQRNLVDEATGEDDDSEEDSD